MTNRDPAMADAFFDTLVAPAYLESARESLEEFLQFNNARKIAVVTSGGTTVPLERNTVRFVDNFSEGTRGARSAELLIDSDYAVVFLHRSNSRKPFALNADSVLEVMEIANGELRVREGFQTAVERNVQRKTNADSNKRLLSISFETIDDYMFLLRMTVFALRDASVHERSLYYLAAAVSDFYIPQSEMHEHKIQSRDVGRLEIVLEPVPKLLKTLVADWAARAFVVTFKLETDAGILQHKAQQALQNYGHQLVVGNLLHTRKQEVLLVDQNGSQTVKIGTRSTIEEAFLPRVIAEHDAFIARATQLSELQ